MRVSLLLSSATPNDHEDCSANTESCKHGYDNGSDKWTVSSQLIGRIRFGGWWHFRGAWGRSDWGSDRRTHQGCVACVGSRRALEAITCIALIARAQERANRVVACGIRVTRLVQALIDIYTAKISEAIASESIRTSAREWPISVLAHSDWWARISVALIHVNTRVEAIATEPCVACTLECTFSVLAHRVGRTGIGRALVDICILVLDIIDLLVTSAINSPTHPSAPIPSPL